MQYIPGLKLELPLRQHTFDAQYYAIAKRYRTYSGDDTTDENANGSINLKFGRLFEARLADTFVKGHEDRNTSATGFIQTFRSNTASSVLTYHLATRSKVQFDASRTTWDFLQSEGEFRNRTEDLFSGYVYYRFLPRTSVFVQIDQKVVSYETYTVLDNTANTGQLGLTWEISENSRGTIKGGYLNKNYDSPQAKDVSGPTWMVDLTHMFSRYTTLTLLGARKINEANVYNTQYYITTGGFGEFSFRIISKLSMQVRGSYSIDQFSDPLPPAPPDPKREDRSKMEGAGLKYSLKNWLDLEAGYRRLDRNSTIPAYDYVEHAYTVSASAIF